MTLLENWRNLAYGDGLDDKKKEDILRLRKAFTSRFLQTRLRL